MEKMNPTQDNLSLFGAPLGGERKHSCAVFKKRKHKRDLCSASACLQQVTA